jgi:hypothetical protein
LGSQFHGGVSAAELFREFENKYATSLSGFLAASGCSF